MRDVDEIDWTAAHEQMEKVAEALAAFGEELAKAVTPTIEALAELAAELVKSVRQKYREAGSPYGDTNEGMHRWLQEEAAVVQAVEKYREQVVWRKALADLRERFKDGEA